MLRRLLVDLDAEYEDLRGLVSDLSDDSQEWDLPTPAEGWAVRDQISHLAYFDDAARMAMVEPDDFARTAEALMTSDGDPMEVHLARGRALGGHALLAWWDGAHQGMMATFAAADPSVRVPWYGPPMGVPSFVSARLMETWAHGQDVADALGSVRTPTDRLRHIAHVGVRARPFSYLVHGRQAPPDRIEVVLATPSGEEWRWEIGESDGSARASTVEGPALDFCLVVTQRRNIADTGLVVSGGAAREWMEIAQACAGPPGPGRPPT